MTDQYPPTILLHGEADTDVPFEQSVMLAAEMKAKGVPHELVSKPHWTHGFDMAGPAATSDSDEVSKALAKQGVSAGLSKRALERTSSTGPYTLWQMVDALTQLSRELPNAGDRFDADQKASQLLSLAV